MNILSVNNFNYNPRFNFKGTLYSCDNGISTRELKEISQRDYEEVKRQHKEGRKDIFVDNSNMAYPDDFTGETVHVYDVLEQKQKEYNDTLNNYYKTIEKDIEENYESFEEKLDIFRGLPDYDTTYEDSKLIEYYSNIDEERLNSFADDFLLYSLQTCYYDSNLVDNFDEILDKFTNKEIKTITNYPDIEKRRDLYELLYLVLTDVLSDEEFDNSMKFLHDVAKGLK